MRWLPQGSFSTTAINQRREAVAIAKLGGELHTNLLNLVGDPAAQTTFDGLPLSCIGRSLPLPALLKEGFGNELLSIRTSCQYLDRHPMSDHTLNKLK